MLTWGATFPGVALILLTHFVLGFAGSCNHNDRYSINVCDFYRAKKKCRVT